MAELALYYAPAACSLVPYVTLVEAGAEFEIRPVNLRRGEHTTPEFTRINAKQTVPVLMVGERPLTENVGIQIWIARNYRHAGLLPADPWEELKTISFLAWCASGIHPRLTPNVHPERYCDLPDSGDSVRRCAQKALGKSLSVAEGMLADGRDWFFGNFTTADAYFFWCFRRATQFGVELAEFQRCGAHFARMQQRASVQQHLAFEKDVLGKFATVGDSPSGSGRRTSCISTLGHLSKLSFEVGKP